MKCFVCGANTPSEVCNTCIRCENKIMEESWIYKDGFLGKNKNDLKLIVSNNRIGGIGLISQAENMAMNGRYDNFSHYLGSIEDIKVTTLNKQDTVVIHIKNKETNLERFIFFPSGDTDKIINTIKNAKAGL